MEVAGLEMVLGQMTSKITTRVKLQTTMGNKTIYIKVTKKAIKVGVRK